MIQAFKMAMKSISGNKFRAFLTMLGIIIGVMALVILVSLVSGATGTVTDTISSLGSNLLSVTVSDDKGAPVTLDTLDEWMADPRIGLAARPCCWADSSPRRMWKTTPACASSRRKPPRIWWAIRTAWERKSPWTAGNLPL